MWVRGDERGLSFDHVERVLDGATRRDGTSVIGRFGGVEVRNEYGVIIFSKREEGKRDGASDQDLQDPHDPRDPQVSKQLQVPGETSVEALGITVRASFSQDDGDAAGPEDPSDRLWAQLDWSGFRLLSSCAPGDLETACSLWDFRGRKK